MAVQHHFRPYQRHQSMYSVRSLGQVFAKPSLLYVKLDAMPLTMLAKHTRSGSNNSKDTKNQRKKKWSEKEDQLYQMPPLRQQQKEWMFGPCATLGNDPSRELVGYPYGFCITGKQLGCCKAH
eukprot:10119379-Ditylum_brightwellii.AAC.1